MIGLLILKFALSFRVNSIFLLFSIAFSATKQKQKKLGICSTSVSCAAVVVFKVSAPSLPSSSTYAIAKGKSYSYILQFAISLGQLYVTAVYFITAYMEGDNFAAST
ncbi:hypothetical protein Q3G72_018573 [Acer saccharum]|nr:hypothetical protein Q3G72_018573 [Acer saccharum]